MKQKRIFIFFLIFLFSINSFSKINYDEIIEKGYKKTSLYDSFQNENSLDLLEKRNKIFFEELSEEEKKLIFPEYPNEPRRLEKLILRFKKLDHANSPIYFRANNDIEKKDNYIQFVVQDNVLLQDNFLIFSIKMSNKNWFHMGAIEFKGEKDNLILNFEFKKLQNSYWDANIKKGNTQEKIAYILTDIELTNIIELLENNNNVDVVLYSDYDKTKKTRKLDIEEKDQLLKMNKFYAFLKEKNGKTINANETDVSEIRTEINEDVVVIIENENVDNNTSVTDIIEIIGE